MEKIFSVSATITYIAVLGALLVVPYLVILAVPLMLVLLVPAWVIGFILYRGQYLSVKPKLHVLVVDDEPTSLSPLLVALNDTSADVDVVTSGQEMLKELKERSFDLLFLDRYMPDLDGEKALLAGDSDPDLQSQTPVIFFTSSADGLILGHYGKFQVRDVWQKGTPLTELRSRLQNVVTDIVA